MKRAFSLLLLTLLTLSFTLGTLSSCGGTRGEIVVELYPSVAPETVDNFVTLATSGFYDGLTFHRAQEGFMIQGGDPEADGTGSSPNKIKGEFLANGFNNTLSHTRGVISMARRGDSYDSASCQFFICNADATFLDGQYAAFGEVVEGMDVVDGITYSMARYGDSMGTVELKNKHAVIEKTTIENTEDGRVLAHITVTNFEYKIDNKK
ncbi:MAG: peptidylprolyl isomerase [Clostridia bacterium]|nr:peptidylprolyl isomerase [Clostridia bacterium]